MAGSIYESEEDVTDDNHTFNKSEFIKKDSD